MWISHLNAIMLWPQEINDGACETDCFLFRILINCKIKHSLFLYENISLVWQQSCRQIASQYNVWFKLWNGGTAYSDSHKLIHTSSGKQERIHSWPGWHCIEPYHCKNLNPLRITQKLIAGPPPLLLNILKGFLSMSLTKLPDSFLTAGQLVVCLTQEKTATTSQTTF